MKKFVAMLIMCLGVVWGSAMCGEHGMSPEEYQKAKEKWIASDLGDTTNMTPEQIEARRKASEVTFVAVHGDGSFKPLDFKRVGYRVRNRYLTDADGGFVGMVQDDGSVKDDGKIIGHVTDYIPDWNKDGAK